MPSKAEIEAAVEAHDAFTGEDFYDPYEAMEVALKAAEKVWEQAVQQCAVDNELARRRETRTQPECCCSHNGFSTDRSKCPTHEWKPKTGQTNPNQPEQTGSGIVTALSAIDEGDSDE